MRDGLRQSSVALLAEQQALKERDAGRGSPYRREPRNASLDTLEVLPTA
jgi:hypothetical protein